MNSWRNPTTSNEFLSDLIEYVRPGILCLFHILLVKLKLAWAIYTLNIDKYISYCECWLAVHLLLSGREREQFIMCAHVFVNEKISQLQIASWIHCPGDHLRLRITWRKRSYKSKILCNDDCLRPPMDMERLRAVFYRKPGPWFTIVFLFIPYRKRLD